jgi:streptogramin lyase
MGSTRLIPYSGRVAPLLAVFAFCWLTTGIPLAASDWNVGYVFVGVASGQYQVYDNNGVFKETISDPTGGFTTGCSFTPALDKLYTTFFSASTVIVFDNAHPHGVLANINTGLQGGGSAESIVFDAAADYYVGHAGGNADIQKYNATDVFQQAYNVGTQARGSDWIELAADQTTVFYTSEGSRVLRYDVGADVQLADFSAAGTVAYALRLLPPGDGSGGLLVADTGTIKRLDGAGAVAQTYDVAGEDCWFSLNLDPNGTSFWSGDFCSSNFYRFNIATGAVEVGPINTGTASFTVFGICLKGEPTAAQGTRIGEIKREFTPTPSGSGRGVAFDGLVLYYSFVGDPNIYKVTTVGASLGPIPNPGRAFTCGVLEFDPVSGDLLCGTYDGTGTGGVGTADVWTINPVTGAPALLFNSAAFGGFAPDNCFGQPTGFMDGLSRDSDGTFWLSDDGARTIYHVNPAGGLIASFATPIRPGGAAQAATPASKSPRAASWNWY